jgi:ankyrin repeat-rich membrane spanning protein
VLIGAVRGGHVEIVRALLQKYADIDIRGQVCVITEHWLSWSIVGGTGV